MNKVYFSIDDDNKPLRIKIDPERMDSYLFAQQYRLFCDQLEQYLVSAKLPENRDSDTESYNNIFAIVGDRGSGKTSCLLSLGDMLTNGEIKGKLDDRLYPEIRRTDFVTVDFTDPSYFDKNNNLLELFLANLYNAFRKAKEKRSFQSSQMMFEQEKEFLACISAAQEHLSYILNPNSSSECDYNSLSMLSYLSASVDLRKDISKLINSYLAYIDSKDSVLVIRIDDIDLNLSEASKMAEIMRTYLMHHNTVILFAVKLSQLEAVKEKEFESIYKKSNFAEFEDTDNCVERYMAKLFPYSQRIYMPSVDNFFNAELEVVSKRQGKKWSFNSVKMAIPQLIFSKTRYLFYNTRTRASYIVPRNLRDLRQLIKLLVMMEDFSKSADKKERNFYNQSLFRKYLFTVWTQNNLSKDYQKELQKLVEITDLLYLNANVANLLVNKFDEDYLEMHDRHLLPSLSSGMPLYHLSLGDILGLINTLETIYVDTNSRHLFFILKTLYSIKLYEAYDEVTEPSDTALPKPVNDEKELYLDERYSELNEYERLVSGSIYNVNLTPFFPDNISQYQLFSIKSDSLVKAMEECKAGGSFDFNKARAIEAIMLCTSRAFIKDESTSSNEVDPGYRFRNRITYISPLYGDNLVIDVSSIFFNLTRIEKCYNRFSNLHEKAKEFVERILMESDHHSANVLETLYGRFKKSTMVYKQECPDTDNDFSKFRNSKWLSYCTMRNVEIIDDLGRYLSSQYYKSKSITSKAEAFETFFRRLAQYKINRYSKETPESGSDKQPYTIAFGYANDIAQVFHDNADFIDELLKQHDYTTGNFALTN